MSCLLHLLCESALSNIKIQRTGAEDIFFHYGFRPAADLGVMHLQVTCDTIICGKLGLDVG
jgi:hypothetical protein